MPSFEYDELKKKYDNFGFSLAQIFVDGTDIFSDKDLVVSEIEVENTCGFEASIATYRIYNVYENSTNSFKFDAFKKFASLGSTVVINMGYNKNTREVFRGFIARVNFNYYERETANVEVTCMDIKGIMMSGNFSKQLVASAYSDAVKEIFEKNAYSTLVSQDESDLNALVNKTVIDKTPDAQAGGGNSGGGNQAATDKTIEMVAESDYEFVMKIAKKFNFEFFSNGGTLYFRKAKSNSEILMDIKPSELIKSIDIGYDITGLVKTIEVRSVDVGKGNEIVASKKLNNKITKGSKAKKLVDETVKVYVDPTVKSKDDADSRASFLAEDISYRFGTMDIETIGLPEFVPGRFIKLTDFGDAVSNKFYIYRVKHTFTPDGFYATRITGKAATLAD